MRPAAPRPVTLGRRLRGLLWYILSMLAVLSPILLIVIAIVLVGGIVEIR